MVPLGESVELVPFRWWHVEEILPLERELFGSTAWSAETYWSELAGPGRHYLLAVEGRRVLGYAGLSVTGADADVQTLAVASHAQRRGLGRLLLEALLDAARRAGATTVLLEVRADNEAAQSLYRRLGFEKVGLRRGYYQPDDVDALVMRRRLRSERLT